MKTIWLVGALFGLFTAQAAATFSVAETRRMSPGVVYKKYVDSSGPWEAFVLQVDLTDPNVQLQTGKSLNLLTGLQTPSANAAGKTSNDYHNIVGAMNGDFFLVAGTPRNVQVADGELLWTSASTHSLFGIDQDKIPFVAPVSNVHELVASGGATLAINLINRTRGANELVLYNRFMGTSTGTDTTGTEIKLQPLHGWTANGAVACTVLAKTGPGSGNMTFSPGQAVLSGAGTAGTFLSSNVTVGDTITLLLGGISGTMENVSQAIGGWPKIVQNGANYAATGVIEESGPSTAGTREPRSAAGYTQDNRTLYMVVVDGRRSGSAGMTLTELADFLLYLGAYTGINFDGGGSSVLVGNGVIRNVPSDGTERAVSNALFVYVATRTLDDFEASVGHFNQSPTSSSTTVGIATSSSVTRQADTNVHSGNGGLKVVLNDNTSVTTPWTVRLLSGGGTPANNTSLYDACGTVSFYMKTSTAAAGATVRIRMDDTDGTEESPSLVVNSDGQWHLYSWDLENFNGATVDTGNGRINGPAVTLDSIMLSQPNTASAWTVYIDDLLHDNRDVDEGLVNLAPNAVLSVDSTKDAFTKDHAVDGNKSADASRWISANATGPHWIQLDWPGTRTISRVKVWSGIPSAAGWQIADFQIQYWDGSQWVAAASVTGNAEDAAYGEFNDLVFAPVATTKLRMYITNPCVNPASDPLARLVEIEAFGPNLASTAAVTVDSVKDSYTGDRAVDGNKRSGESRWISANVTGPHWFQLDWPVAQTVHGVKAWSGSASAGYQIADFAIQYWTGSAWATAASVTSNAKDASLGQFNDLVFTPVTTTKLRMYITDPCVNPASLPIARLFEFEAY